MIIGKCPLRVSLVGGSTDLHEFIMINGKGGVISFPCTLYTYVSIGKRYDNNYRINYTNTETVSDPNKIKNDIAREVIKYFNLPPITVQFNCDIPSSGSGLAASSSYLISMIKAVDSMLNLNLCQHKICEISLEIERIFNPLTGYQDTYGCGIGGFKRIDFIKNNNDVEILYKFLSADTLNNKKMYLISTNVLRSSTNILSTLDLNKVSSLYEDLDLLNNNTRNPKEFFDIINKAWIKKKETSSNVNTQDILELEKKLVSTYNIDAIKLCGAGGGGYFLLITDDIINEGIQINIDNIGCQSWKI